mmetsp:Transcript_52137/g.144344  ORF Transcript_52137/g.144344 Transcript_52137/m.144344 type:complete len:244 (+) Transcript_52137:109-840(+)
MGRRRGRGEGRVGREPGLLRARSQPEGPELTTTRAGRRTSPPAPRKPPSSSSTTVSTGASLGVRETASCSEGSKGLPTAEGDGLTPSSFSSTSRSRLLKGARPSARAAPATALARSMSSRTGNKGFATLASARVTRSTSCASTRALKFWNSAACRSKRSLAAASSRARSGAPALDCELLAAFSGAPKAPRRRAATISRCSRRRSSARAARSSSRASVAADSSRPRSAKTPPSWWIACAPRSAW